MAITTIPSSGTTDGTNMVLLNTTTISSSVSNVNFDSTLITSTYKSYKIIAVNLHVASDSNSLGVQLSADNGTTMQTSSYDRISFNAAVDNASNSVSSRYSDAGDTKCEIVGLANPLGNAADEAGSFELDMYHLTDANFKKIFLFKSVYTANNSKRSVNLGATGLNSSLAFNYVRVKVETGNIESGQISLYGVRT